MRPDAIFINRRSSVPLHRQIESAIREAILSGALRPGERMLSSRELQMHLGVSRNTVTEALNQLHAEGFLVMRRGAGTFVALTIRQTVKRRGRAKPEQVVPSPQAREFLSAQSIGENANGGIAFRPGIPAPDFFPLAQWKACFRASDWTGDLLDYPQKGGLLGLRAAIANRLRQTRGVECSPEQIFITSGAQAAFALVLRVLLHNEDTVIVEDPCYPNALSMLRSHPAKIFPVATDYDGIRVDDFRTVSAKAAFVTPSHQYPTGAVLSLARRIALLQWALHSDAWVIEDDYDTEFNYTGRPEPTLYGLDEDHRVIYVGTFSKVLSPALRVAYVIAPESLVSALEAAHEVTGAAPSIPIQAALGRFIERGHLSRHISKMRKIYNERRRFVSEQLLSAKGSPFTIRDSASGLHFIAELPPAISDSSVSELAAEIGISLPALSSYYVGQPEMNGLVVGYAGTSISAAEVAIAALFGKLRETGMLQR